MAFAATFTRTLSGADPLTVLGFAGATALGAWGGAQLLPEAVGGARAFLEQGRSERRLRSELARLTDALHALEEALQAGVFPPEALWDRVTQAPAPWGPCVGAVLSLLRKRGAAVVPTLKRLRQLVREQRECLEEARAKSAPAQAQAMLGCGLVPLFGGALSLLLPDLWGRERWLWVGALIGAGIGCALAIVWTRRMAEQARWGALPPRVRGWLVSVPLAAEQFGALVRAGFAADIAWHELLRTLHELEPELATEWGRGSLYEVRAPQVGALPAGQRNADAPDSSLRDRLAWVAVELKRAAQVSVMEGRSCLERVESLSVSLQTEIRSEIQRRVQLLSTQALKPLFFCVAPALFGLAMAGLYLGLKGSLPEDFAVSSRGSVAPEGGEGVCG